MLFSILLLVAPSTLLAGGAGPEPGGSTLKFVPPPFQGDVEVSWYSDYDENYCITAVCTVYNLKSSGPIEIVGNDDCYISFDFLWGAPVEIPEDEFSQLGPKDFRNWEFPSSVVDFSPGCDDVYGNQLSYPGNLSSRCC